MSTAAQIKHREKWGGQSPKLRRLAFMRQRYKDPPRCRACPALAHWTWNRAFYCQEHLPATARAALDRISQVLFDVAPFFDEPETEDVPSL